MGNHIATNDGLAWPGIALVKMSAQRLIWERRGATVEWARRGRVVDMDAWEQLTSEKW